MHRPRMGAQSTRRGPNGTASEPPSGAGSGGEADQRTNRQHAQRITIKIAATIAVLAGGAVLASTSTWSNLNATANNPSNSFTAGTVQIGSNSGSSAVLSLTNAKPGAVTTGCIQVSYTGTLPATVKLYGTGGGTGLLPYLNLVVTRGTFSGTPGAGSCTGFTPDSTNYISQGAGVIFSGTLATWPATASAAVVDPTAANPAVWSTNSSHGYQLQVTLASSAAGQGLSGTETFTFEADNN
jgi:hypothetical protein